MSKEIRLSPDQIRARDESGKNIIVSAAAGSGKTAVLSKRVCRYVLDGGDIDRLLIVTFTKAAAGEMRARIARELDAAARENPTERLKKQVLKAYSAQICTIDSFLGKLIKDHFEKLGVAPNYTMMDAVERELAESTVLADILEEKYRDMDEDFAQLDRLLGGDGENETLNLCIRQAYRAANAAAFPQQWMEYILSTYNDPEPWIRQACEETQIYLTDIEPIFTSILDHLSLSEAGQKTAELRYDLFKKVSLYCQNREWDNMCREMKNYLQSSSVRLSKPSQNELTFKTIHNLLKSLFEREIYQFSQTAVRSQLDQLKAPVRAIFDIVQKMRERLQQEMRRQNAYTFDEISHLALQLLVKDYDYKTHTYTCTETAEQLRADYDEIMIDECQDVNDMQNLLFESISNQNLFIVGDSKQCIYAFRGSNPDIFTKRKKEFFPIVLQTNYRSRQGILDFSNFIFERLMSEPVGGVDYNQSESLAFGGLYPPRKNPNENDVEICFYEAESTAATYLAANKQNQLKRLTQKVQSLLGQETITEKDGSSRSLRPSDIAILVRTNTAAETIETALTQAGIPAYAKSGSSFLDTTDVCSILAFLRVLDNPYDEIALFKTLTGRMFAISEQILAQIKAQNPQTNLYTALNEFIGAADQLESQNQIQSFLETIKKFRLMVQNMPLHTVVWQSYQIHQYLDKISCLPAGTLRRNALMQFYTFVLQYEQKLDRSLHRFLEFADRAKEEKTESEGAAPQGEFVKIMTMHASKGLEFPVCMIPFLEAPLQKRHGGKKEVKDLVTDSILGIATTLYDDKLFCKYNSFMFDLIQFKQQRTECAEALRLMYVAFTRAKEKLILFGTISRKKRENGFEEDAWGCYPFRPNKAGRVVYKAFHAQVLGCKSFLSYVLNPLAHHPSAKALCVPDPYPVQEALPITIDIKDEATILAEAENTVSEREQAQPSGDFLVSEQELDRRFQFRPQTRNHIPAKISVTELAKGLPEQPESLQLIPAETSTLVPAFLRTQELSGAQRGTAVHRFMAYADLSQDPEEQVQSLVEEGILTEEQKNVLPFDRIRTFQNSDLFARMQKAHRVLREEPFLVRVPASYYDATVTDAHAEIFLQGAIDALCEWDDGYELIDYKTDRATEEQLRERYHKQLEYYRLAVEKTFEKPVRKMFLWSFWLQRAIDLDNPPNK